MGADGQARLLSPEALRALAGTCCYALNVPLPASCAYEPPLLLEAVSRELLHVKVAQDAEEAELYGASEEHGEGVLGAVAFRLREA